MPLDRSSKFARDEVLNIDNYLRASVIGSQIQAERFFNDDCFKAYSFFHCFLLRLLKNSHVLVRYYGIFMYAFRIVLIHYL